MNFYRWCMRYGAAILFVIAGLQVLIGIIVVVKALGSASGGSDLIGGGGPPSIEILVALEALIRVFANAALTFFGALLINRLDKRADPRQAEPFE